MRRRAFVTTGLGVGTSLLAGCTSGGGDQGEDEHTEHGGHDDEEATEAQTATEGSAAARFRLLISDQPAAIGDFDSLTVSFSHARVFGGATSTDEATETATDTVTGENTTAATDTATASPESSATEDGGGGAQPEEEDEHTDDGEHDEEEENETEGEHSDDGEHDEEEESDDEEASEDGGFSEFDLEGQSVDLTEVVGDAAISVLDGELSPGRYTKIELHAADVVGIVDGEEAEVKIPSGKLMLTKPFEVAAGESVDFVFDINVVKRGNGNNYNLLPVIGESGVAGTDVEVEEVGDEHEAESEDEHDEETDHDDGTGTQTASASETATEEN